MNPSTDDSLLLGAMIYVVLTGAAVWLALILWTLRDMKARSRDALMRMFAALFVALFNVPGLLIYLFLRPRETLAEAYERSLEEEALLQEIEEKPVCPTCGIRSQENWQVCPSCHTRLKKICVSCSRLLDLSWNICPYCATSQAGQQEPVDWIPGETQHVTPRYVTRRSDKLEFVDSDEF
jgi:hypothetical protein